MIHYCEQAWRGGGRIVASIGRMSDGVNRFCSALERLRLELSSAIGTFFRSEREPLRAIGLETAFYCVLDLLKIFDRDPVRWPRSGQTVVAAGAIAIRMADGLWGVIDPGAGPPGAAGSRHLTTQLSWDGVARPRLPHRWLAIGSGGRAPRVFGAGIRNCETIGIQTVI